MRNIRIFYKIVDRSIKKICHTNKGFDIRCSNISPTIYLEEYYERFRCGEDVENLCYEIILCYRKHCMSMDFDIQSILSYERAKDNICFKLVNAEQNRDALNDMPHFRILDMAVVYCVLVERDEMSSASILVQNWMMERWGVTDDEISSCAIKNTQKVFPASIINMKNFLREQIEKVCMGDDDEILKELLMEDDMMPVYVASNAVRTNGAGVLFYPEVLKQFADSIGSDLYVIPSSIHETLWIPATEDADSEELREMLLTVNATDVLPEEKLSDNLYFYDRKADRLKIV